MVVCPLATFAWLWGHLDARHETAGTTVEAWLGASAEPVDRLPSANLTGDHPLAMPPSPIGEPAEATQIARSDRIHVPAPTESSLSTLHQKLERAIPWVVLAWLVGVVTCSLRLSLGWMRLRRVESAGGRAASRWQELAASVAQRLRLSKSVRFLESALVEVPTVVGWLRPIVLLPSVALSGLTPRQLEALLAHELAHIRRNDYLVNLLQTLIETLLFYHPAVWWVSARMRQEREHCCDDLAIRLCGDRIEYVRALASLEELRATAPGLAVAAGDGSLLKRVRRLIGSPETKPGGLQVSLLTLAAVLLIGTMFIAPLVFPAGTMADPSQNQQPTETSDEESGETTLLIANWGAVLDEPVVQQLRKLSVEDVKSQDGVGTWFVNADKAREMVCAARDRKQFVMVSTSVEWLSEDSAIANPVGFCTVSGIEDATSSP
ncbi:MAG: M56 family metallopeptidase, partial [Planctomycetes bacterium]|nr:M56 family metallopeptidase [Planctomycetota bacterium]